MDRRSWHALSSQHFLQESSMRNQAGMSVICGMVFALLSSLASAAGREAGDACSF
jgi:hypothetical protein